MKYQVVDLKNQVQRLEDRLYVVREHQIADNAIQGIFQLQLTVLHQILTIYYLKGLCAQIWEKFSSQNKATMQRLSISSGMFKFSLTQTDPHYIFCSQFSNSDPNDMVNFEVHISRTKTGWRNKSTTARSSWMTKC